MKNSLKIAIAYNKDKIFHHSRSPVLIENSKIYIRLKCVKYPFANGYKR